MTKKRIFLLVLGLAAWAGAAAISGAFGETPRSTTAAAPATATAPASAAAPVTPAAPAPAATPAEAAAPIGKIEKLPPSLGAKEQDSSRLVWESLAAVAVILVLGGVAIVVVRRVMPRIAAARGKQIQLAETFHLGQNRAVHLLHVGSRSLLVGASREGISLVADVTGAVAPPEAAAAAKPPARFTIPGEGAQ